jgi:hypothetical protein
MSASTVYGTIQARAQPFEGSVAMLVPPPAGGHIAQVFVPASAQPGTAFVVQIPPPTGVISKTLHGTVHRHEGMLVALPSKLEVLYGKPPTLG